MTMPIHTHKLDTRWFLCPIPIIKLKKLVDGLDMEDGEKQIIKLYSDDPVSDVDVRAWCLDNGQELGGLEKKGKDFIFKIIVRI